MSIRAKVVLLVLPLIIAPLLLTGFVASLSARNGITSVATSLLAFKMDDLTNYANSQWSLLVENNFIGNQEYVDAARSAVGSYAQTLVRGDSELIFALDANGKVAMSTSPLTLSQAEGLDLIRGRSAGRSGWMLIRAGRSGARCTGSAVRAVRLVLPGHRKTGCILPRYGGNHHADGYYPRRVSRDRSCPAHPVLKPHDKAVAARRDRHERNHADERPFPAR